MKRPPDLLLRSRLKAAAKRAILEFGCCDSLCRQYLAWQRGESPPGEKRFLGLCRQAYREAEEKENRSPRRETRE